MIRTKLPAKLFKNNILIKLPPVIEDTDEEGLVDAEEENNAKLIIAQKGIDCSDNIEIGDEVLISSQSQPKVMIEIGDVQYAMFREADLEGTW